MRRPTHGVMAGPQSSLGSGADQSRSSAHAALSELREDVHPLGQALRARAADVLELTAARRRRSGIDAAVQTRYDEINQTSTLALARWLAGEGPQVARQAGNDTWLFHGELAAHRAASLEEVTLRCLWWRDAVAEVLRQSAAQLHASSEALSQARQILQHSTDFGLIRTARSFDGERQRTDDELAFLATHDALTGLPNRTLILDRAQQMLARGARNHTRVAALSVDIDNFKTRHRHPRPRSRRAASAGGRGEARRRSPRRRCIRAPWRRRVHRDREDHSLQAGPEPTAGRLLEALKPPFSLAVDEEAL